MNLMQTKLRGGADKKPEPGKMSDAASDMAQPGAHESGDGDKITIERRGNGFHSTASKRDGSTSEADHQSFDEAVDHAGHHLGAKQQPKLRQKNPRMLEKDNEPMPPSQESNPSAMLSDMGIDAGE